MGQTLIPDWLLETAERAYKKEMVYGQELYAMLEHVAFANKKPIPTVADLTAIISDDPARASKLMFEATRLVITEYKLAPLVDKTGRFIKFIKQ